MIAFDPKHSYAKSKLNLVISYSVQCSTNEKAVFARTLILVNRNGEKELH